MNTCTFLEKLPIELRLRIYEHLVAFSYPIKLRQIIQGSRDLAILRTNRQIYEEALSVLYDLNTIIVTRNDFCINTDAGLKTPINLDRTKHLLIPTFSQSIICMFKNSEDERCRVCHPSAAGLISAFDQMRNLRTVVVDYQNHLTEMRKFAKWVDVTDSMKLEAVPTDDWSTCHRLVRDSNVDGVVEILFKRDHDFDD